MGLMTERWREMDINYQCGDADNADGTSVYWSSSRQTLRKLNFAIDSGRLRPSPAASSRNTHFSCIENVIVGSLGSARTPEPPRRPPSAIVERPSI